MRPLLFLVLAAAGCADSHAPGSDTGTTPDTGTALIDAGTTGCGGAAPVCHDALHACCIPSTCVGTAWMCPRPFPPMASCPGVGGSCNLRSCSRPSQCVAVPESCCGDCGAATPSDLTAVNVDSTLPYRSAACAGSPGCDGCVRAPDPHLVATCDAAVAQCEAIDLGSAEWAGCTTDADCRLRAPTCCDCSTTDPVAIRADRAGALTTALCDPDSLCPDCVPIFDPLVARCEAGTCVVR